MRLHPPGRVACGLLFLALDAVVRCFSHSCSYRFLLVLLLLVPPFLLAGSANTDPRRSQNRLPGGGQNGLLEASGGLLGPAPSGRQGRSGAAPGRLLERSWRLSEPSWSALGASWSRLGVPGRSPEGAREVLLGGIFGNLPREAEKSTMFNVFFTLFGAFV